jgi:hypothetical protein
LNLLGALNAKEKQQPMRCEVARKRWNVPPLDLLKINTDGSFIPELMEGSWGFIIRDHDGDAVLAGAGRILAAPDALTVEAIACQQALQAATDIGISRIQVEVDSVVLKHALQSHSMDLATCGMMIRDTCFLLRKHFDCNDIFFLSLELVTWLLMN